MLHRRLGEMKFHSGGVGGDEQGLRGLEVAKDRVGLLEVIEVGIDMFGQCANRLQTIGRRKPLLRWNPHLGWIKSVRL